MSLQKVFYISLVLLLLCSSAFAYEGYVQQVDAGRTIAWGSGAVTVTTQVDSLGESNNGGPSPLGVRRAASKARKLLLDLILSLRIDSRQTVSAYLADDEELAAQLRGLIHNSLFKGPDSFRDIQSVTVSESLRGQLAELIIPKTIQFQSAIPPRLATATGPAYLGERGLEGVGGTSHYTGIVVDARSLSVTPCLLPVIYGDDGMGAYGAFLVSRADAIAVGVAAYTTVANPSAFANRVGKNPLVVKAMRTYGSWQTDLIVSAQEAALIRATMRSGKVAKGGCVILLNPSSSSEKSAVKGGESNA